LGEMPDAAVARRFGVANQVVWQARTRRGIPRHVPGERRNRGSIDWGSVGLGERPDQFVAEELRVSRRTVCYERNKRGIRPFIGVLLTQEGEPCRSIYEAMYDAHLHGKRVRHQHEVRVADLPFIADFRVGGCFIEVIGMRAFERYRLKLERKRRAYEDEGIPVRWIEATEARRLFHSSGVVLRFRSRECCDCKKRTHDLVKGVCRPCYMRRWRDLHAKTARCESCRRQFDATAAQRFCSRACYWTSLELDWPSWDELDQLLKEKPIRQVAFDLNVGESTLYMRLRRRRNKRRGPGGLL
jgi:hypothetical protein